MCKRILLTLFVVCTVALQACKSTTKSVDSSNISQVEIHSGKYLRIQFLTGVELSKDEKLPVLAELTELDTYDKKGLNKNNNVIKKCRIILDSKLNSLKSRVSLTATKMTCMNDNKTKDIDLSGYVTDDHFVYGLKATHENPKSNSKNMDIFLIPSGKTGYFFLTNNLSISL